MLCSFASAANSQNIKIRKLKKIDVKENAYFPSFSNNKNEILYTGANYTGLSLYNTRSKKVLQISEARNAGAQRIIKDDKIIFKQNIVINGKKTSEYKSFDYSNKQVSTIKDISSIEYQEQDIPRIKINGKQIDIQYNSSKKESLAPLGDCYYLWASISPDGSKILFTATTHGTYVTDLKGNILHEFKNLNAPSWINDNWVVGMDDIDDGERILTSEIISVYLPDNKIIKLTEKENIIAMYPKFSKSGDRIAFNTPDGFIYTAKVRIKN